MPRPWTPAVSTAPGPRTSYRDVPDTAAQRAFRAVALLLAVAAVALRISGQWPSCTGRRPPGRGRPRMRPPVLQAGSRTSPSTARSVPVLRDLGGQRGAGHPDCRPGRLRKRQIHARQAAGRLAPADTGRRRGSLQLGSLGRRSADSVPGFSGRPGRSAHRPGAVVPARGLRPAGCGRPCSPRWGPPSRRSWRSAWKTAARPAEMLAP